MKILCSGCRCIVGQNRFKAIYIICLNKSITIQFEKQWMHQYNDKNKLVIIININLTHIYN